ncbi:MAG: 7TM diverse intracellular signaling domain-containing protein [Flavobacteriales bacterium]
MKDTNIRFLFLIHLWAITSLLSSCSNVESEEVNYSLEAAFVSKQNIDEFNKTKFESFDDLNLGFFKGNVWIKLTIHNEENENRSFMLLSNNRFIRNYKFYKLDTVSHSLKLVHQIPDTLTADYRTYNNPNPNFKLDLSPNERAVFLITFASDGRTIDANAQVVSLHRYFSLVNENTIWSIVFYSVIVFLLLINLYLWNIYKHEIYLYYLFYLFSTIFVYLGIEGFLFLLKLPQLIIDHFIFVFVKLWVISLIIYTSKFLEIEQVAPQYYRFIKMVLIAVMGCIFLYQFVFFNSSIQHLHYFENVLIILWLLLIIGILIFSAKDHLLALKYYLIPFVLFIGFTVFGIINVHFKIFAGNSITYVKIGTIMEFIGFTYFMTALIKKRLSQSQALEQTLKEREKVIATNTGLISALKMIENSVSNESDWADFEVKFKLLNPNFTSNLFDKHPDLTKSEIRLLVLIRIGYSQKEIAEILNIAPDSVKKARSRVRKKLSLGEDDALNSYIEKF